MKSLIINTKSTSLLFFASLLLSLSCTKNTSVSPKANKIDPGKGAGNEVITVTGTGLKNVGTIAFDLGNVPVDFNPNLNADGAIIFRVPTAANVGSQHIVFTTLSGYQFSVPFLVLAVPTLTSSYPAEWAAGNTVTITGNYLATTDHVAFEASSDTATILSKTATTLVLQMPASAVPRTKLVVHNDAGSTTSTFLLLNMDKQLQLFTEDLGSGMQNWSWCTATNSTSFAVSGTTSFKALYGDGQAGGQGLSFHYDFAINTADYTTLSFWVKGGTIDNMIKVNPDAVTAGDGSKKKEIAVPAGVWTYFEIPMTGNFDGITCQRFNFQIEGSVHGDQTLYYDNVLLVK